MKTVKPLLTIGAAFLINTLTQYIVETVAADESATTSTGELKLSKQEVTALSKIGLDATTLKQVVNKDNVEAVEQELTELKGDAARKLNTLIGLLNAALAGVTVELSEDKPLEEGDDGHIKDAVGKAVKAVREEKALEKINLTPEKLRKALNINNLADVQKALDACNDVEVEEQWNGLMTALKATVKNKDLTTADKSHIKDAVGKAVAAVLEANQWMTVVIDIGNNKTKAIGAVNLTDTQLKSVADMLKDDIMADLGSLNLGDKVEKVKKIGLKVGQWKAIVDLVQDGNMTQLEAFNKHAKFLANPTVTGAAKGAYLSSAVMLAPLAAWFLF